MGARLSIDTRICIVGAGPAGITAALEYQRLGYRNVVVLERAARVGGRCRTTERGNDLGAVAWVPWYFDEVTALSDELGLDRDWVPFPVRYREGRARWPFPPAQVARAAVESVRYLAAWPRWQGVRGPGIGDVSPALTASYRDFVRDHHYQAIGEMARSQTSGYGYRWDAPALYNVRYIPPRAMVGTAWSIARPRVLGGGTGLGFWKRGTQAIWEGAVARYGLDVRTSVEITAIDRSASGGRGDAVVVHRAGGEPVRADVLVLACNPRGLLGVLDASPDERRLYAKIRTVDYRTYECTVRGLGDGRRRYGWFDENLRSDALDRPLIFFKRDAARADVVFYVNADGASDDVVEANLGDDLCRIGARLERVTEAARFEYAPYVDGAALADGFYVELDRLQGQRATLGVGATYTFDIMAHVMPQARDIVRRHVAGDIATASVERARRAG